jgi:hypothetical protein
LKVVLALGFVSIPANFDFCVQLKKKKEKEKEICKDGSTRRRCGCAVSCVQQFEGAPRHGALLGQVAKLPSTIRQ